MGFDRGVEQLFWGPHGVTIHLTLQYYFSQLYLDYFLLNFIYLSILHRSHRRSAASYRSQNSPQPCTLIIVSSNSDEQTIVFFDGVCGLCNRSVDCLLQLDGHERLLFAPLQGETAAKHLTPEQIANLDTFYVLDQDELYQKSAGWFVLFRRLGMPYRLLGAFRLIPSPLLDALYDFIAKHRYRWFGKYDQCRLPTAEEQKRFLP